jgi:DNA-binding response OmpR family regulator
VFTREQLLAMVWKNEDTGPRSVDVHVLRLRSKVGFDVPLVLTLRGVGYRLHAQARVTVVRGHRL